MESFAKVNLAVQCLSTDFRSVDSNHPLIDLSVLDLISEVFGVAKITPTFFPEFCLP